MVNREEDPAPPPTPGAELDESIRALAHPGRRTMLRLVWDAERPASDLAEAAGLSRSAASQHLKLLREAGLVSVRADGNRRLYRAELDRVAAVASFLDEFWASPLTRLSAAAEQRAAGQRGAERGTGPGARGGRSA
ncbi:MAG: winged helix-turn-helix transcriptional regulator [Acidimicrobiales bacterium]|nr:winged helix-turn-helix transcriptional regulator [Acidimicrobiales bacterium]